MARTFRAAPSLLGYTALTIILTAGAAQSLSGSNTVFTDDLVAGAVTTSDIRANAVTSGKIATGGVFSSDIASGAVGSSEVADGSLKTADVAKVTGSFGFDFALIAAQSCSEVSVDAGVDVTGDVILVTPSHQFGVNWLAGEGITVTAMHTNVADNFVILACNPNSANFNPTAATFEWVVFDK